MGCGCGGKKFTGSSAMGARSSGSPGQTYQQSATVVKATGVKIGTAPAIQPMQRKTV